MKITASIPIEIIVPDNLSITAEGMTLALSAASAVAPPIPSAENGSPIPDEDDPTKAAPESVPHPKVANLTKLVILLMFAALAVTLFSCVGCAHFAVTPPVPAQTNSVTGIVTPPQPAVTNVIPNPTLSQVTAAAQAAEPFIPAPWNALLLAGLGLATAVSTAFAKSYSNTAQTAQASANSHAAAAAALAAAVVQTSQAPLAMTIAATNGSSAAVAQHLQSASSPT